MHRQMWLCLVVSGYIFAAEESSHIIHTDPTPEHPNGQRIYIHNCHYEDASKQARCEAATEQTINPMLGAGKTPPKKTQVSPYGLNWDGSSD